MPLDLSCPACRFVFPVTEARHPIGVLCPGCETKLTAEFRRIPVPAPGESPYELLVKTGSPAGSQSESETSGKKLSLDDEDRARQSGSMAVVIVSTLGALLSAVAALGLLGYFLFTDLESQRSETVRVNPVQNNTTPNQPRNSRPNPNNNNPRPNPNDNNPRPIPEPPKKKADRFDLKPVPGTLPAITPAKLPASPSVIDFGPANGRVGAVAVAAGGRYLFMHFPDTRKLGLFDTAKGQMIAGIDADGGDVKLAAGIDRAVAYIPNAKLVRVYSLPDLRRLYDASTTMVFHANTIAMGNRTNGPLIMCDPFGEIFLYDVGLTELKEIEGAQKKPGVHSGTVLAFPDGTGFSTFEQRSLQSVKVLTESALNWKVTNMANTPYPGVDGLLYGNGVINDKNGREIRFTGAPGGGSGTIFIPAIDSASHFLKIVPVNTPGPRSKKTVVVTVHANRNAATPVAGTATITGTTELEGMMDPFGRIATSLDQNFFLIEQAKLLVILQQDRKKLTMYSLDLK